MHFAGKSFRFLSDFSHAIQRHTEKKIVTQNNTNGFINANYLQRNHLKTYISIVNMHENAKNLVLNTDWIDSGTKDDTKASSWLN